MNSRYCRLPVLNIRRHFNGTPTRVAAAERYLTEIEEAFNKIQRNPESYLRWDDTYHFYLLDVFPYFIAYRYSASLIAVVAIRHTSQDQDAWQGR